MLDSHGPILKMPPSRALELIQDTVGHSHKWNDEASIWRMSNDGSDGIAAITNKLDSLGRDIKKLKKSVHGIKVGFEICEGMHLTKECPLKVEGKVVEEVKYGEFGRPFQGSGGNGARYRAGPQGYYTRLDNHPPFGEKKTSLEDESTKRQAENDEWMKKFRESTDLNLKNQDDAIKSLDAKEMQKIEEVIEVKEDPVPRPIVNHYGEPYDCGWRSFQTRCPMLKYPGKPTTAKKDPWNCTLPCSIGSLTVRNVLADLGASINIIPFSLFKRLGLGRPKPVHLILEMADRTTQVLKGMIENVLVKIDKFIFPVDFVILDMIEDFKVPIILGRPLLAIRWLSYVNLTVDS
ncbi:hypothetical protein Tco_1444304 [Tanacetum coccineum]